MVYVVAGDGFVDTVAGGIVAGGVIPLLAGNRVFATPEKAMARAHELPGMRVFRVLLTLEVQARAEMRFARVTPTAAPAAAPESPRLGPGRPGA